MEKINKEKEKDGAIDPELFINKQNVHQFTCPICQRVPLFENFREIKQCGHSYCLSCLKKWITNNKTCPYCRVSITKDDIIRPKSKLLLRIISNEQIKCPLTCDWIGAYCELENHLKNCEFRDKPCKYKKIGCNFEGNFKELAQHENNNDKYHLELSMKFIELLTKYKVGNPYKVTIHDHPLIYVWLDNGWKCNCSLMICGCKSGITDFLQTQGLKRFRCEKCDFDLCEKCLESFLIK